MPTKKFAWIRLSVNLRRGRRKITLRTYLYHEKGIAVEFQYLNLFSFISTFCLQFKSYNCHDFPTRIWMYEEQHSFAIYHVQHCDTRDTYSPCSIYLTRWLSAVSSLILRYILIFLWSMVGPIYIYIYIHIHMCVCYHTETRALLYKTIPRFISATVTSKWWWMQFLRTHGRLMVSIYCIVVQVMANGTIPLPDTMWHIIIWVQWHSSTAISQEIIQP